MTKGASGESVIKRVKATTPSPALGTIDIILNRKGTKDTKIYNLIGGANQIKHHALAGNRYFFNKLTYSIN